MTDDTAAAPVLLIPALSPDERLLELTRQVLDNGVRHIIIIDDGSDRASADIFTELEQIPACSVLRHRENRGKGRALKTGMRFFLENFPDSIGVVTADCDGQHTPADIETICDELAAHPDDLILGVRDFSMAKIPPKSRFGNLLTKSFFHLLTGLKLNDTQTGLRGIPTAQMEMFCSLKGERFEYELNMLLACKQHHIAIQQIPIATIYLYENSGTHFNPFTDSIRIYLVLLKFVSSSLISFLVDYGSFILFLAIFGAMTASNMAVFWAGIVSRVISSTVNYTINRLTVFKSDARFSTMRYYILCVVQMIISSGAVAGLNFFFRGGAPIFKIIVDSLLFLASFTIQREWVFAPRKTQVEQVPSERV